MLSLDEISTKQDQLIAQAIEKDGSRLRNYIRKRVIDQDATEDILQDVFSELVEAYRMLKPIEQVSAWLFRVAKNRIIDRFRGKKLESLSEAAHGDEGEDTVLLVDLLPSLESGPEAAYAGRVVLDELDEALDVYKKLLPANPNSPELLGMSSPRHGSFALGNVSRDSVADGNS